MRYIERQRTKEASFSFLDVFDSLRRILKKSPIKDGDDRYIWEVKGGTIELFSSTDGIYIQYSEGRGNVNIPLRELSEIKPYSFGIYFKTKGTTVVVRI